MIVKEGLRDVKVRWRIDESDKKPVLEIEFVRDVTGNRGW